MPNLDCLEEGFFSKSTLKPLKYVYNYETEKKLIKSMMETGEWFSLCGLRRTGKTTLVRSIANSLRNVAVLYVDMWGAEQNLEYEFFFERLKEELERELKRSKLDKILGSIKKVSFFGVSLEFRIKSEVSIYGAIEELSNKKKIILIIDEAQKILRAQRVIEALASLHDRLGTKLSVAFTGSVISIRKNLSGEVRKPLYGRIADEITLSPWDQEKAKDFLLKGFSQCGVKVKDEIIDIGLKIAGGFVGWLALYGRVVVRELRTIGDVRIMKIANKIEEEASEQIYDEIARFLQGRKNINGYISIIKRVAEDGFITVSEVAKLLKKDPSTAVFYINELLYNGILKKVKDYYVLADPLVEKVARKPEFGREVKTRI